MEQKTKVVAEEGKQEIRISRVFELPLESLFKAYVNPEIVEHWMGTKVIKLESKKHGSYHFETTDPQGNKHGFNGTIHEFEPNQKITRTFEMENTTFPVQLEFLEFQEINENNSKLEMLIVFKSISDRDNLLKLPFAFGLNRAHNKLEELLSS
ncbi:ATPase [Flavobacteriaceae bacterium TP-CH-4]|uniref:ATPase n=1 Tax=Pelagihabitans pacificus TaxID=2696054 RepID=A0A967AT76_9FLAO|nr:SRPBCC domain-containing protein [Pelagihabitans pacificus]NHF58528.1 ATPase [Pelagihabitans pacificus]